LEAGYAQELLEERFDAGAGRIALINNTRTLRIIPSPPRATCAPRCDLGSMINTDEDIVLLHIATHGDNDYSSPWIPAARARQLPECLGALLADSASMEGDRDLGVFLRRVHRAAQGRHTLIITAADAFHSSFGCDYESDYTWFSQAFYDEALRDTFSLRGVRGRERNRGRPERPRLSPSNRRCSRRRDAQEARCARESASPRGRRAASEEARQQRQGERKHDRAGEGR